MKINLSNVTLLGIDCVDVKRLQEVINICELGIDFAESKILSSLPLDDKRLINIPHIGSIKEFSRFCLGELYKYVNTEYVLLVQYDGFVLNPKSWKNEFLNYDYIGAPWFVSDNFVNNFKFPKELHNTFVVGCGGFSLRSKKFLEISAKLSNEEKLSKKHPEDVVVCVWDRDKFEKEGMRFADADLAKDFSIEGDLFTYENQFGFHGFEWTNIDTWIDNHKEFTITYDEYKKRSGRK